MRLVTTDYNPAPPGAIVEAVQTIDGRMLRLARWDAPPGSASPGTVLVCQGRSEFLEKYFETIGELLARGFAVVTFDWRGQGISERELPDPRKGHIDDFALYERDAAAVFAHMQAIGCPQPWHGLAHSMGAAILLRMAEAGTLPLRRMTLTAPLIDIARLGYPRGARALAEFCDIIGLGGRFIPGGGPKSIMTEPFEGNLLSSDPQRYARNAAVAAAAPELCVGSPSIGWVNAAFRQMKAFEDSEFPRRNKTPALVIMAGADKVVANAPMERFATRLKAGMLVSIPFSEHEILMESDAVREQFWAAFDAFIPGATAEPTALVRRIA
jgi:lysophospholipase